MSSKILYRRILLSQSVEPSSPPHPHKTPTHSHTIIDEVSSTTDNPISVCIESSNPTPLKDTSTVDTQNEPVTSTDTATTEKMSKEQPLLISQDNEMVSTKITLGDTTEIKGVIFDMDGTLTIPVLRFSEMKEKLGLKPTDDILPVVQKLPTEERVRAFEIIEEFEKEGMEIMKLQPGVLELFQFLGERDIERALVTRNARLPTNAFLKRLDEELEANRDKYPSLKRDKLFSMIITREFEPCKPHPAAVFEVVKSWQLSPEEVVFVGDDKTDMMCGLRAGVGVNILLRNERNEKQPDYSHFTVNTLPEIITLMSSLMTVPFKQELEP